MNSLRQVRTSRSGGSISRTSPLSATRPSGIIDSPGRPLPVGLLPRVAPILAGELGVDQRLPQLLRRRANVGHVDESRTQPSVFFSSSCFLRSASAREAAALELADPALGDLVDRHRVEVVQLLAAPPDRDDELGALPACSRCLVTACRVMARCAQSSPSVWPFSARSRSSSWRRLGSASALNTSSMTAICNHLVACQVAKKPSGSSGRTVRDRSRSTG